MEVQQLHHQLHNLIPILEELAVMTDKFHQENKPLMISETAVSLIFFNFTKNFESETQFTLSLSHPNLLFTK